MKNRNFLRVLVLFVVFILLSVRLILFIRNYSVNLPYDDQWWLTESIAEKKDFNDIFFYWHNEHRIGFGLLVTKFLATLSNWNTIYENYFTALILIFSALLAFRLKYKLTGNISLSDIFIPVLFLNLHQYEILLNGMISYLMPLLWLLIFFWILELKKPLRDILIFILTLISTFTSFHGIFIGLFGIMHYLIEIIGLKRKTEIFNQVLKIILITFIMLSYFINVPTDQIIWTTPRISDAIIFTNAMILQVLGFQSESILVLIIPLPFFVFIFYLLFHIFFRKKYIFIPVLLLFLFAELFVLAIILGRGYLGIEQFSVSRYVSYVLLLFFASYLTVLLIPNKNLKIILLVLFIPILIMIFANNSKSYEYAEYNRNKRKEWIDCYLNLKSVKECNALIEFKPMNGDTDLILQKKIIILEENKLSFFAGKKN